MMLIIVGHSFNSSYWMSSTLHWPMQDDVLIITPQATLLLIEIKISTKRRCCKWIVHTTSQLTTESDCLRLDAVIGDEQTILLSQGLDKKVSADRNAIPTDPMQTCSYLRLYYIGAPPMGKFISYVLFICIYHEWWMCISMETLIMSRTREGRSDFTDSEQTWTSHWQYSLAH